MAHLEQLKFVELTARNINKNVDFKNIKVLEIGSYIVNQSLRQFFPQSIYTGVDLLDGPGVDIVSEGSEVNLEDLSIDVTISCECFEHNPKWVETFKNMYRMTKKSGIVVISTASKGRLEHGTTRSHVEASPGTQSLLWDYYKNLSKCDFESNFELDKLFSKYVFYYNLISKDLYFVGKKTGVSDGTDIELDFDENLLTSEFKEINYLVNKENSISKIHVYIKLFLFSPLFVLTILPDSWYQEFAIPYNKIINIFKKIFKYSS